MDEAIIPRAIIRQRGADAFDRGRGIDDHNMNPWAAAVADWQAGYRERQAAVYARDLIKYCAGEGISPP